MPVARPSRSGSPRRGLRWIAGVAALGVAASAIVFGAPAAGATTSVSAQLTLAGVASPTTPTGGAGFGAHPGDSVSFSSSALPTAGLPAGLGELLGNLLGGITGFQVTLTSGNLPGISYPYALGSCPGAHPNVTVTFPTAGTYNFTYSVQSVQLLCLGITNINLDGNQLKSLGVALN